MPRKRERDIDPIRCGELVARLRGERSITQQELSHRAGIDRETISRVEQGRSNWRIGTARRVFDALYDARPIREADARAYLEAFGLSTSVYEEAAERTGRMPPQREAAPADEFLQRASPLLLDIAARIGYALALQLLTACHGVLLESREEETRLILKSAPRYRADLGATEIIETEFVREEPPAPGATSPHAHPRPRAKPS